jgi:hypothetical protein
VQGTYVGTIANADGRYQLRVAEVPAVLIVRFIGYTSETRTITADSPAEQHFALDRETIQLDEIVVSGEDPAVRIMREVIERKKVWRSDLHSVVAESYNRFALSNDTGIVSVAETVTEAHWDARRGMREVLLARRSTSNIDFADQLPAALFVANLYDDDLEIAGHRLMGVSHPDALDHYRFALDSTRTMDGRRVFDISVEPKNARKSAFVGRVSVLDDEFGLVDVELRPSDAFLFPPPIQHFAVTYRQQFSRFDGDFWLPVDFRAEMDLKVGLGRVLNLPVIRIGQVSRFADYQINTGVADSLFEAEDYLSTDSVAVADGGALERAGLAVPLTEPEQLAYNGIDSTMTLRRAFAPSGLLGRLAESGDDEGDGKQRWGLPVDIRPELWYNRVDALHAGLELHSPRLGPVRLAVRGGYNSGLDGGEAWTYGGLVQLKSTHGLRPTGTLVAEAVTALRFGTELYSRGLNALWTVLGGRDYYDYYRREGIRAAFSLSVPSGAATLSVNYTDSRHSSLPRTTDWQVFHVYDSLRANPAVAEGRLRSVGLAISAGDAPDPAKITGLNRLSLSVERSLGSSDFEFTQVRLVAEARVATLYRRRLLSNVLDVRLTAGLSTDVLPLQKFGSVESAMGPYGPFGSLKTSVGPPYEGHRWLGFFWEHNFRTIPFELLGMDWLVRNSWNLIVFGGHARTWAPQPSEEADYVPNVPARFHQELGLSLSGIFSVLRADVAFRLDENRVSFRLAAARIF